MKAIRVKEFGGPEVLRLEELADPKPGAGQVVVELRAIGVNPVDTYVRSGLYPRKPPLPYVPGSDAAGVIESVGKDVRAFKPGDRVYIAGALNGAYAQKALCLEPQVHPLPPGLDFPHGAAVNVPYATAYRALFLRARALPGEWVLVHGASGGVGTAALQLGRAAGLRMIGTAGTEKGRKLVSSQGAEAVIQHGRPDFLEKVGEITAGRGVDVIVEMLANVNLGTDLKALAPGGRVAVVGSRGTVEIDPRDAMGRDASILGLSLANSSAQETASIHAALGAGLANGLLKPIIGRTFPLAEAAAAHRSVLEPGAYGKIVLLP